MSTQAMAGGKYGNLYPRSEAEFFENMLDVDLHRGLGNVQIAGDLFVTQTLGNEKENVLLTR